MAKLLSVRDDGSLSESKRLAMLASISKAAANLSIEAKTSLVDPGFAPDSCLSTLLDSMEPCRDTALHCQYLRLIASLSTHPTACSWAASVPLMDEVEQSLQSEKPATRIAALAVVSAIARKRRSRGVLILAVRKLLANCLQGEPQLIEATLCTIEILVDTEDQYQNKLATPTLERLADLLLLTSELLSDKAKNSLFNIHLTFARNELVAGIMFQLKILKHLVNTLNGSKDQSTRFRCAETIVAMTQHEQYASLVDPDLHKSIFTIFSLDGQVIAQQIASEALLLVLRAPEVAKSTAHGLSEGDMATISAWVRSPVFDIRLNGLAAAAILAPYVVYILERRKETEEQQTRLRLFFTSMLEPLTAVMRGVCEEEQTLAMSVMKSLSASSSLQAEIVEHGVLDILLSSVSSKEGCIRLNALETLHNIATEEQHQGQLARSSMVIAKLLVVTRDQEELPLTLHALRTLVHLARFEEHQLKIVEAGVVEPIVAMALQNLPEEETGELLTSFVKSPNVNVQWSAAIALHALSKVKPMARKLARGGGIAALMELFRSPSQDARMHVCATLARLCLLGDATKKAVADFDVVPMILRQIEVGGTKTLPEALSLLGCICLCKDEEFKKAIIAEQAIPCLAGLLKSPIALIRQRSLNCIRALACDDEARAEIATADVLVPLHSMAHSSEDKPFRKDVLGLVAALARCPALHSDLEEARLLQLLPRKQKQRLSEGRAAEGADDGEGQAGEAEGETGADSTDAAEAAAEEEDDEVSAAEFLLYDSDEEVVEETKVGKGNEAGEVETEKKETKKEMEEEMEADVKEEEQEEEEQEEQQEQEDEEQEEEEQQRDEREGGEFEGLEASLEGERSQRAADEESAGAGVGRGEDDSDDAEEDHEDNGPSQESVASEEEALAAGEQDQEA